MQNKANFKDAQMNVNIYYIKVYKNESAFRRAQNKPNSNPINTNQSQNKPNPSGLRCLLRSCQTDQTQSIVFGLRSLVLTLQSDLCAPAQRTSIEMIEKSQCLWYFDKAISFRTFVEISLRITSRLRWRIKHILFHPFEGGSYETVQTIDCYFVCSGRR